MGSFLGGRPKYSSSWTRGPSILTAGVCADRAHTGVGKDKEAWSTFGMSPGEFAHSSFRGSKVSAGKSSESLSSTSCWIVAWGNEMVTRSGSRRVVVKVAMRQLSSRGSGRM